MKMYMACMHHWDHKSWLERTAACSSQDRSSDLNSRAWSCTSKHPLEAKRQQQKAEAGHECCLQLMLHSESCAYDILDPEAACSLQHMQYAGTTTLAYWDLWGAKSSRHTQTASQSRHPRQHKQPAGLGADLTYQRTLLSRGRPLTCLRPDPVPSLGHPLLPRRAPHSLL